MTMFSAHKVKLVAGVLILICLIVGFRVYRYVHGLNQARTAVTTMLKSSPYRARVPRNAMYKVSSGSFSVSDWYECTFATNKTLTESKKYLQFFSLPQRKLTLKNCPIVYRVIVRPPTKKIKHWTGKVYLDTNQVSSTSARSLYVHNLNGLSVHKLSAP